MITDPWFYACAVVAVLIVGIAKGGLGGGVAIVGVPLMSLTIGPIQAAAIMLPILCAMDLFGVHAYRGLASRKHLGVLLPGALVGIALGAFAFGTMPVDAIRLVIGGIAVLFALNRWFRVTGAAASCEAA